MRTDVGLEVELEDSKVLIDFLVDNINISKTRLKKCIQIGAVWLVDGDHRQRMRKATSRIQEGDIIEVFYDDARLDSKAIACELIEDCEEYSVWYKPQGIPMQGDDFGDHHCVSRQLEFARKGLPYWPITLPSDAQSGLFLLAHSRKMASVLNDLLNSGQIESTLLVTLEGDIDASAIDFCTAQKISFQNAVNQTRMAMLIKTDVHGLTKTCSANPSFQIIQETDDKEQLATQEISLRKIAFTCPISKEQKVFESP
ncbi:hypothetical protein [Marinicellulosiphila megalodicopiae]|uniref:hypothetical protein n=1 Tax=Marinicellulosiphila megalodicopiae TaxID=2724896 RepID=UPI003BB1BABB